MNQLIMNENIVTPFDLERIIYSLLLSENEAASEEFTCENQRAAANLLRKDLEFQQSFKKVVEEGRLKLNFKQSSLHNYFDGSELEIRNRELNLPFFKKDLEAAASTQSEGSCLLYRTDIAQLHNIVLIKLCSYVEPLKLLAGMLGFKHPEHDEAWKTLTKIAAPDVWLGKISDKEAKKVLNELLALQKALQEDIKQYCSDILCAVDTRPPTNIDIEETRAVAVFNPHGWALSGTAILSVEMPVHKVDSPSQVRMFDDQGIRVPCQISNLRVSDDSSIGKKLLFDLVFRADHVPACGYKIFHAAWGEEGRFTETLTASPGYLENAFIKVEANPNGTITITDKRTGSEYPHCLEIFDVEEASKSAPNTPSSNSSAFTATGQNLKLSLTEYGPVRAGIRIDFDLALPASLDSDGYSRSKEFVNCPVTHEILLEENSSIVYITTTINDNVSDHQLILSSTAPCAASSHRVDTWQGSENRSISYTANTQKVDTHQFQCAWRSVDDGMFGLAIFNRGIIEMDTRETPFGVKMPLTFIRDIPEKSIDNAKPRIFETALYTFAGTWQHAKPWKASALFHSPFIVQEDLPHDGDLGSQTSVFTIENDSILLRMLKREEFGKRIILRLYNPSMIPISSSVRTPLTVTSIHRISDDELSEVFESIHFEAGKFDFILSGGKTATFAIDAHL